MKTLRKLFICLVLSLIVPVTATPAFAQGFKWWQTERFQKELALTTEQVTRIEGIYQSTEPLLRAQKKAVDKYEEKLSKTITDPKADEPMVVQAIDRLEAARSEVSRTRNLLLFRIRRVLTDEQNVKMRAMHDHDRSQRENADRNRRNNDKGSNKGGNKGPGGDDNSHPDCQ
jgi:Spy/CpxP family protein refolding chaperone